MHRALAAASDLGAYQALPHIDDDDDDDDDDRGGGSMATTASATVTEDSMTFDAGDIYMPWRDLHDLCECSEKCEDTPFLGSLGLSSVPAGMKRKASAILYCVRRYTNQSRVGF